MRYENPWRDVLVDLGEYGDYDLYFIPDIRGECDHLGARYSNNGPDYLSGEYWVDQDVLYGGHPAIKEAFNRYARMCNED